MKPLLINILKLDDYPYTEEIKRAISFEPVNGIYSPVDRYGAGNAQGNNKAWILKSADGFDIRYLTPDNQEIGIRMGTDGKVRIDGFAYDIDAIRAAMGMATSGGTAGSGAGDGGSGTGGSFGTGVGFDLRQINADGTTSGITVDASGYTDIGGLRKPVTIDFKGRVSLCPAMNKVSQTLPPPSAGRESQISEIRLGPHSREPRSTEP